MSEPSGNLEQVRAAIHGITGIVPPAVAPSYGPDRYLVMARMNRELDTVDSFRRRNIPAYWPSYEMLVPMRGSRNGHPVRRLRRVGLIPGYVFGSIDAVHDLKLLLETIVGAIDVVRTYSGNPLLIDDADIHIIRKIEGGLNTPRPEKIDHSFKIGQKVSFTDDLIGRWPAGRIVKIAPDGRINVDVDMMGRKVPITVLPFQIERA